MYVDDNGPPRFDARRADGEAKVRIDAIEVIDSTIDRRHFRFGLAWAELHRGAVASLRRGRAGETLDRHRAPPMIGLTPDITDVRVVDHGVLRVTFADGLCGDFDVLDRMRGAVFERARTTEGFVEAALDPESGAVTWPGGADLAPDTLYVRARTGMWPGPTVAG